MRILYSHRIQSRDGQSLHVEEIAAALRAAGHDVRIVGPGFYAAASFGGESKIVLSIRRVLPAVLAEVAELAYNLVGYFRLSRACREFAPDLLYERYNLYYLAGALLARRRGLLFYLEVNSPLAAERARFGTLRFRLLARALERWVWRSADRVFAVSGVLKKVIAAAGIRADRIQVVPNGVVPSRYTASRCPAARGSPVILGFVGFVRDWHGLDVVIRAMANEREEQINLVVVGDGPARPALERQARAEGIADRVRVTGVVPHTAIPGLIAGFDIALQPKAVSYASPLKIFEYMASGRAIVAPDQPNIREVLQHERTALLFGPEDGAMWRAVRRLASNYGLRQALGDAARNEITRCGYTWECNAGRIVAFAELDLNRRAAGPLAAGAAAEPPK